MAMSNRLSSTNYSLLVLLISLLLVGAYVAKAQNRNANSAATASPSPSASPSSTPATSPSPNVNGTNPNVTPSPSPTPDLKTRLVESTWYWGVVSVIFFGLLIGFAATIMRVILRSKSSFRSPLGLPDGSLRAVLAFLLVAFIGFYVYANVLSLSTDLKIPDSLLGIIATVIGFYFGSRSAEGAGTTAGQTGGVRGTVVDSSGSPTAGATVELSQGTNKRFTHAADLNGKFDFDNVPTGDYDIQASLTGHAPSDSTKVKVAAGGTQTVNLKLK